MTAKHVHIHIHRIADAEIKRAANGQFGSGGGASSGNNEAVTKRNEAGIAAGKGHLLANGEAPPKTIPSSKPRPGRMGKDSGIEHKEPTSLLGSFRSEMLTTTDEQQRASNGQFGSGGGTNTGAGAKATPKAHAATHSTAAAAVKGSAQHEAEHTRLQGLYNKAKPGWEQNAVNRLIEKNGARARQRQPGKDSGIEHKPATSLLGTFRSEMLTTTDEQQRATNGQFGSGSGSSSGGGKKTESAAKPGANAWRQIHPGQLKMMKPSERAAAGVPAAENAKIDAAGANWVSAGKK